MTFAVIKRYGEASMGQRAALLTYYSFWSLFPLLLVLSTAATLLASSHPTIEHDIVKATGSYFPVLGDQLSAHITTLHKNGLALVLGVVLTLYGARGVADTFRRSVEHIWRVPTDERVAFPKTIAHSLLIIIVGGLGFVLAAICAGLAAGAGHGVGFRLLSVVVNLFTLFWLFMFLLWVCLPRRIRLKEVRSGALAAAVGLVILQTFGGYLLKNELRHLDALYSYFAVALGLLFWIYLQAQVLYYAVTLSAVRDQKAWPRSLRD